MSRQKQRTTAQLCNSSNYDDNSTCKENLRSFTYPGDYPGYFPQRLTNTATTIIGDHPPSVVNVHHISEPIIQPIFGENEHEDVEYHGGSSLLYVDKTNNGKGKIIQVCQRFRGIFYALMGTCLFSSLSFMLKQSAVDVFDAILFRFLSQTIILLVFISHRRYSPFIENKKVVAIAFLRASVTMAGTLLYFLSFKMLPLPDLTTVRYTQVIWTVIIAMIIFHEKLSIPIVMAIILTLTGVICVSQPSFFFSKTYLNATNGTLENKTDERYDRMFGLLIALLCAILISMSIVLNKKLLTYKIKPSIIMFHGSLLTFFVVLIIQVYKRITDNSFDLKNIFTCKLLLASMIGIFLMIPLILTQKAINLEHPSIVTVVQSFDIVFTIILQNVLMKDKSNWLVLLGSALVVTSILLVGGHKLYEERHQRTMIIDSKEKTVFIETK
ncbi:unnamed protein product [Didymodactylos carnosus]|uniref:EamA domain-containing protein n=1 Tax=Didymodactylos carnosus TaxID=1234261 RepID=A0A814FYN0_9BILA|nr:unnamed protein product [Didymodactylos carnosus]CAF0987615.1 unnamed protein product [Didymodactylos carnosus]CAF3696227.1 unnamed protein product [Didymodactylos carnosus]CAF3759776.1 unnamed protein product [Didymodactylos carnosus]